MFIRFMPCAAILLLAVLTIGCDSSPQTYNTTASNMNAPANTTANETADASTSPTPSPSGNSNSDFPISTGSGANSSPTPTQVGDDDLDAYLASLPLGEVSFNAPEKMKLNESVNIEVKLGGPKLVGQTANMVTGEGRVESHRVKVARVMEAQLAGANFHIIPITNTEQPVSQNAPTEWEWQVKATGEGKQRLHLTLSVVVAVDGKERRRKTETFKKDITVEVTSGSRISEFLLTNVGWIVPVLILPLVGALFVPLRKLFRRNNQPPPAP